MRTSRFALVATLAACFAFGACSSDKKTTPTTSTVAGAPSASTGADVTETQPPVAAGDVDCAALKDALSKITINWQVVIGLANSPVADWGQIPLGTLPEFGAQLATAQAGLGSDSGAAEALSFMAGANDIVVRGIGGDAAAQTDLAAYMGTDTTALISKQIPIVTAYTNLGCD